MSPIKGSRGRPMDQWTDPGRKSRRNGTLALQPRGAHSDGQSICHSWGLCRQVLFEIKHIKIKKNNGSWTHAWLNLCQQLCVSALIFRGLFKQGHPECSLEHHVNKPAKGRDTCWPLIKRGLQMKFGLALNKVHPRFQERILKRNDMIPYWNKY